MLKDYTQQTKSRFERKFTVNRLSKQGIELVIKQNSAFFSKIYEQRYINNIYLDTPNLTFFFDNNAGKSNRKKIRIRWYGDMFGMISYPILEFKIKTGDVGNKFSFPLKPFLLDNNFSFDLLKQVFHNSNLPQWALNQLDILEPTLLNRYKRKYFRSFDKYFRLTIDSDINYANITSRINTFSYKYNDEFDIVVELKYDIEKNDSAQQITNQFPFRMTKNSKYVNGISKLRRSLAV